jgi:hypothetical protein
MDEQSQFKEALEAIRQFLPDAVFATCECLNDHGEWEIALTHCQFYLKDVSVPDKPASLIAACAERFCLTTPGMMGKQDLPKQS